MRSDRKRTINNLGKVINFYSFKGGVGRTVVLRKVSQILEKLDYKIAVIDMDLECPGYSILNSIPLKKEKNKRTKTSLSFLSLAKGFLKKIIETKAQEKAINYLKGEIASFLNSRFLDIPTFIPMNSDRFTEHDFDEYVAHLKYLEFNEFVKVVRLFLKTLIQQLQKNFDFILIDNRTGLSETAIWNIRRFADINVWVLTLSHQNIEGIRLTLNKYATPPMPCIRNSSIFIFVANISPPVPEIKKEQLRYLFESTLIAPHNLIDISYAPEPVLNELFTSNEILDNKYRQIVNAIFEVDSGTMVFKKRYSEIACQFLTIKHLEKEFNNNSIVRNTILESASYQNILEEINSTDNDQIKLELINMLFTCLIKNKMFSLLLVHYNKIFSNDSNLSRYDLSSIFVKAYVSALVINDKNIADFLTKKLDIIYFKKILRDSFYDKKITIDLSKNENDYNNFLLNRFYYSYLNFSNQLSDSIFDSENFLELLVSWYLISNNIVALRAYIWPPNKKSFLFSLLNRMFKEFNPPKFSILYNSIACINADLLNQVVPSDLVKLLQQLNEIKKEKS